VRGGKLGQRDRQPAAGLEIDLGAAVGGQFREASAALPLTPGRKAFKAEPVGGQAGDGQRGRHRRRTGQSGHPQARRGRRGDEPVARIADRRGTRVGDEQDVLARFEIIEQADRTARLDRVVVGNYARLELDVQARREPAHPAGVLGRDQGGLGQLRRQPGRRVLRPADRDRRQRQHTALARCPGCLAPRLGGLAPRLGGLAPRLGGLASGHVRIASCSCGSCSCTSCCESCSCGSCDEIG
jgi:hypothetical protein